MPAWDLRAPKAGEQATDLDLLDESGRPVQLSALARRSPILVPVFGGLDDAPGHRRPRPSLPAGGPARIPSAASRPLTYSSTGSASTTSSATGAGSGGASSAISPSASAASAANAPMRATSSHPNTAAAASPIAARGASASNS